jgi:hypothetical protein
MRWQQGRDVVDDMVERDVPKVQQIIDVAAKVLDEMSPL